MLGSQLTLSPLLGAVAGTAGAVACILAAIWVFQRGETTRQDRDAAVLSLILSALWAGLSVALGAEDFTTKLAESARNIAIIYLLFKLFANDGRDASLRMVRSLVVTLFVVELFQPLLLLLNERAADNDPLIFQISALLHLLVNIGALVLLHNLYAGAAIASRNLLRVSAIALAGFWLYELNLHTFAYLSQSTPELLIALQGVVVTGFAVCLGVGSHSQAEGLQFSPSRTVTFRSLSLLLITGYLLAMVVIAQSLAAMGGELGRVSQVSFLILACVAAIIWIPSRKMRGWLRVHLTKHLFQHRYDYRAEWRRFTDTVGNLEDANATLQERAIKAIADITDSGAGLLLIPTEEAELELVSQWQWPDLPVPSPAASQGLAAALEESGHIVDFDQIRSHQNSQLSTSLFPEWALKTEAVWAAVPLLHFERLIGVVILSRPALNRSLDWEDFDLLRVAGRQLASYLAEQSGQQALMEATRFDEFNRRIAFVMHDVKNLASQLSLLAGNAEKHAEKPEFRKDMLITLRNSSEKLNTLLARLGRYGASKLTELEQVDLAELAGRLVEQYASVHRLELTRSECSEVICDKEALNQALQHLIQNAIDASAHDTPVSIDVSSDGGYGKIQIVDCGEGMTPEFIRNGLFKPFVSSKDGGFGIGAFEASELIRAMGGRLNVESQAELGTCFTVTFPLASTSQILNLNISPESEVA